MLFSIRSTFVQRDQSSKFFSFFLKRARRIEKSQSYLESIKPVVVCCGISISLLCTTGNDYLPDARYALNQLLCFFF